MHLSSFRKKSAWAAMALAAGGGLFLAGARVMKADAGLPADKVTVAGSTTDVIGAGQTQTVLSAVMKTSAPEDLVLQLTSECSIVTQVFTSGTASATASGEVDMQVLIDGTPVPIVSLPGQNAQKPPSSLDDGRIVFCDRVNTQSFTDEATSNATTGQDMLTEYERTKQTDAFNWAAFNVGAGTHTISVQATFCTFTSPDTTQPPACTTGQASPTSCTVPGDMSTCADAIIGNRTFIIDPTSLAQNQTG
ncbi:MAG TPA: hypothetical protein VFC09_06455 [Candidatus Dormibacteraeota bacterium]|nr:hypothetical protein [Candidatus Dormibacteraeota bacterium]